MCDDHHHHGDSSDTMPGNEGPLSRREALRLMGAVGGAVAIGSGVASRAAAAAPHPMWTNGQAERSLSMAGHLHGAFSEGTGSAAAHYAQARRLGVDAVAMTDHDWRLNQRCFRRAYHFSGMSEKAVDGTWQLVTQRDAGLSSESGATITKADVCPADSTPGAGSLRLTAESKTSSAASLTVTLSDAQATKNSSGPASGRTLHLWVKAFRSVADSYLSLSLLYSYDPVNGKKQATYRFRQDLAQRVVRHTSKALVTVDLPVGSDSWTEVVIDPASDASEFWPDQAFGDSSLTEVALGASATNGPPADGLIGGFSWEFRPGWSFETGYVPDAGGYDPLKTYTQSVNEVAAAYPDILSVYGLELSVDHHFNQIGGTPFLYPYADRSGRPHPNLADSVGLDQVAAIRLHGGVATANHPFGASGKLPAPSAREQILTATKKRFLEVGFWGVDVLETGYDKRDMDLAGHQSLFDCACSNGYFITANGVSDDHAGNNWARQTNRFLTHLWTGARNESSIQAALRGGRAVVGRLGDWSGALDLTLNDRARMGQVLIAPRAGTDRLAIEAQGLPQGCTVRVLRGEVDYSGAAAADPTPVQTLRAGAFAGGGATVRIAFTGTACFYRVDVVSGDGRVLAFSNPVYRYPAKPDPSRPQIPPDRVIA